MSLDILPSNEVSSSTAVTVRETTLRPGDKLVITTDDHLGEIDLKISDLLAEDIAIKEKINEISNKLIHALNGVRLVGICPNTKLEVLANEQILTDYVNAKFTDPADHVQPGDVVSTIDKYTFVYLSDGMGGYGWQQYNAVGDVGDILTRLDQLELDRTDIKRKIAALEVEKDTQLLKNNELDTKISDLERADVEINAKIGDLQGAGYTSSNAGGMFREIKSGLESLNSKTDTAIRELVSRLTRFTTDITSQAQTAESQSIQANSKADANVIAIADIKNSINNLIAKDAGFTSAIGTLSNLRTGNRNDLVEAINEVFHMVNSLTGGSSGGGIEATVLNLSNALGAIDTLGGETIVSALGKLRDAINLKASTQALNEILTKIGSDAINGELTQNIHGALNDLLNKVRDLGNQFDSYLPLTGGSITGAITYSNVDTFTAKQVPHVEWVENKLQTVVGEMATIGTVEFSTIAGAIREVNELAKQVELDLVDLTAKVGDLNDTGCTDKTSVATCIKEVKGITDNIILDNTATKQKVTELESNKADKTAVEAINEKLSLMEGASVVIDIIPETKDEVEGQLDKNGFLEGKVTDTGKPSVEEGYEIRTSDGYSYIYKNGLWKLVSLPPVAIATDSSAGIVKFKDEEGYVTSSPSADGTMVLKGYTELKGKVEANELAVSTKVEESVYTAKVGALESSITSNGQLAQEAKDKAEANSILVAANTVKADDAVLKATNAENIATTADGKADNAITVAGEAKTESAEALAKANEADQHATEAKAQSQTAETTANDAVVKAEEANTKADQAVAKATEVETKVGDVSSITGTPSTVVEAIEALRTITGELATISGVDNTDLATSIMAVKAKVEEVNVELSKFALLTGSQFTGVNSYDGSVSSFTGAEIPHAEWVENKVNTKVGTLTTTGLSNTGDVAEGLKELKDGLDLKADITSVTAVSDKFGDLTSTSLANTTTVASCLVEVLGKVQETVDLIGDLTEAGFVASDSVLSVFKEVKSTIESMSNDISTIDGKIGTLSGTGITSISTVTDALKDLKDSITALENKDTSVLEDIARLKGEKADKTTTTSLANELSKVQNARVLICKLTETKDQVEGQSDKQAFLDRKVTEAGKATVEDGYEVATSDKYEYIRFKGTWNLVDKLIVSNATEAVPGLIKLKDEEGSIVSYGLDDGTVYVKGFAELKALAEANKADIASKDQAINLRADELAAKDLELVAKDTELEGRIQANTLSIANTQSNLDTAKVDINASIATVSNKVGDLSTTGVPSTNNGTVAGSIKHLKDRLTAVERADTDITASIQDIRDNKADVSIVEALTEEVSLIKGATVVTNVITETKQEVEDMADAKQAFLTAKAKEGGKKTMKNGFVIRTSDGYMYYYFSSTWYLIDKVEITNATTTNPGLIKFKDQLGYVVTGDGDGTAIVKGFTDLYNQVGTLGTEIGNKITESEAESLVDGKLTVLSAKVDGFDSRLTTNESKANTAVTEIASLSQTVTEHTRAIQSLRTDSIGNIQSTGFAGDNVGDMLRSARAEVDDRITIGAAEAQIREAFSNLNTKITTLQSTADGKLDASVYNSEKSTFALASDLGDIRDLANGNDTRLTAVENAVSTQVQSLTDKTNAIEAKVDAAIKIVYVGPGEVLPSQLEANTIYIKGN